MRLSVGIGTFLILSVVLGANAFARSYDVMENCLSALTHSAGSRSVSTKKSLRLTTWNIQKFSGPRAAAALKNLAQQSDIVLLQESMMGPGFDEHFESYEEYDWHSAASFKKKSNQFTGVATGARYQPLDVCSIQSAVREPFTNTPKMILITKYQIEGTSESLLVANIHGINFVPAHAYRTQIAQLVEAVREHNGPMIIAGDFNVRFREREKILNEMADALQLLRIDFDRSRKYFHFDHVFVRGLKPEIAVERFDIRESDHHPLYVVFQFN